jgi:hypothetical protein
MEARSTGLGFGMGMDFIRTGGTASFSHDKIEVGGRS